MLFAPVSSDFGLANVWQNILDKDEYFKYDCMCYNACFIEDNIDR